MSYGFQGLSVGNSKDALVEDKKYAGSCNCVGIDLHSLAQLQPLLPFGSSQTCQFDS